MLQIWIRMGLELLPESGIIVPDPNPAKNERAVLYNGHCFEIESL